MYGSPECVRCEEIDKIVAKISEANRPALVTCVTGHPRFVGASVPQCMVLQALHTFSTGRITQVHFQHPHLHERVQDNRNKP